MVLTFMGCTTKTALKQFMHLKMSPKSQKAGCLVQNLQWLEQRQDEEVCATYRAGKYVLAVPYQNFKVPSNEWDSRSETAEKM